MGELDAIHEKRLRRAMFRHIDYTESSFQPAGEKKKKLRGSGLSGRVGRGRERGTRLTSRGRRR